MGTSNKHRSANVQRLSNVIVIEVCNLEPNPTVHNLPYALLRSLLFHGSRNYGFCIHHGHRELAHCTGELGFERMRGRVESRSRSIASTRLRIWKRLPT